MVYVRSLEMISYRKMSLVEPNRGGGGGGGVAADKAPRRSDRANRRDRASTCSAARPAMAPGQMPMRSIKVLGSEGFRSVVRRGVNSMPRISRERHLE